MNMEEKLKRYWMGKNPKVKAATMKWITGNGRIAQAEVAKVYGITSTSIVRNVTQLRKLGLIIWSPTFPCISCGIDLSGIFPKFGIIIIEPNKHYPKFQDRHIKGYLCTNCAKKFPHLQE